jgi:predicted transcriptional regulator
MNKFQTRLHIWDLIENCHTLQCGFDRFDASNKIHSNNLITVDAIEVLIKYCTNSFPQLINSFDRKLINFLLLLDEPIRFRFRTDWPIGNAQEVKRNLNSYELINLRKWIHAIFYQHFHCIDSKIILLYDSSWLAGLARLIWTACSLVYKFICAC